MGLNYRLGGHIEKDPHGSQGLRMVLSVTGSSTRFSAGELHDRMFISSSGGREARCKVVIEVSVSWFQRVSPRAHASAGLTLEGMGATFALIQSDSFPQCDTLGLGVQSHSMEGLRSEIS